MLPDPSTSPAGDSGDPGDGQEPDDYPPPEWPEPDFPGTGQPGAVYPDAGTQGLFLSVPAGSFDADRFAQSGPAGEMPPDPLLATIIDAVTGPAGPGVGTLTDDQLIGVIAAVRRLESRVAWYALTAVAEFAARWGGEVAGAEFAADQLACELHLTSRSAAVQLDYAAAVTGRLPRCLAALFAGLLHPVHLRIIEEETQILSAADAAAADAVLAETAGALTFGKLRSVAHRMVLDLDPEAAQRRKEAGRRNAHVQPFREPSGNAGMIARELPSDEVLASWQHIEQRALDLRAAGIPGTLEELRVRAYLDLLQERHTHAAPPIPDPASGQQNDGPRVDGNDGCPGLCGPANGPGGSGPAHGPAGGPDGSGRAGQPGADTGPSLAALVNITVQWSTLTGQSATPAEVGGYGTVDAADARDLAAAASRDPRTRWCVTALHPDDTAAAHGCVPGRHSPPPGSGAAPGPGPGGTPGPGPGPDPPPGTRPQDWITRMRIRMTPITRGSCDHHHAEAGYRPSRKLRHIVRARNARCTAPGCGRPAAKCDVDHTIAWDHGGLTCECDLAPLCRHHHRCKQAEGWQLEQPEPGVLVWRTPAGRVYTTRPTQYLS